MAAKNARSGNQSGTAGDAASSAADDAGIRELIDSGGSGEANREGSTVGGGSGGSELESGDGGSARAGSGIDGGSGAAGSGSDEDSGTGTRQTRRTRNRSRSTRRGSGNAASQETRSSGGDFSRTVEPPKRPKIDIDEDIPSTNGEIIGDMFAFTFWGIGQATGLPEWELDEDDASTIGQNGSKWLKSLGPKRAKAVVKQLSKIGPSLAFFGSVGMALVPRVKLTINVAKNGAIRPIQERKVSGGSGPAKSTATSRSATTPSADNASGARSGEVPFTAKDFSEVTQGFAGTDDGRSVS